MPKSNHIGEYAQLGGSVMFTRDRLNLLLSARGFETDCIGRPHEILDMLDDVVRINTTGGMQYAVFSRRPVPINGVGARIRAHESLVAKPPPLIDDSCGCNCCQ